MSSGGVNVLRPPSSSVILQNMEIFAMVGVVGYVVVTLFNRPGRRFAQQACPTGSSNSACLPWRGHRKLFGKAHCNRLYGITTPKDEADMRISSRSELLMIAERDIIFVTASYRWLSPLATSEAPPT